MRRARNASGPSGIRLMPDGASNSAILRTTTRPSDVESAVSASADEGVHVCVFGSEAQPAHTRSPMPSTANRPPRPLAGSERVMVRRLRVVCNGNGQDVVVAAFRLNAVTFTPKPVWSRRFVGPRSSRTAHSGTV